MKIVVMSCGSIRSCFLLELSWDGWAVSYRLGLWQLKKQLQASTCLSVWQQSHSMLMISINCCCTVRTSHSDSVVQCCERHRTSLHRVCMWCASQMAAGAIIVAVVWCGRRNVRNKWDVQGYSAFVADVGVQSNYCLQALKYSQTLYEEGVD